MRSRCLGEEFVSALVDNIRKSIESTSPAIEVRKVSSHGTTGGIISLPRSWKGARKVLILDYSSFAVIVKLNESGR